MRVRSVRWVRLFVLPVLLVFASTPAFAQATASSSLSGLAVDADGGVIPGATVVVKNNATGVSQTVVTNSAGKFAIPSLDPGTYTVTVSLTGFKTYVTDNVRLLAGRPGDITAKLEVGALTETVSVKAGSELIQTQSATVTSTLSVEQLKDIPLVSRNALYAVNLLPGVATTGGPRAALINGLPNNTVNITIDGVGTGNMLQSGDGFFSMVTPRMDAIEEITITGAVPGSGAGAGSVQVQFSTKSGTNSLNNTVYHYARRPSFNANYFFNKVNNLERNQVIVDQYGGSSGGPIVIPGLVDGRGKAFYFFNFEHLRQPSSATRTRTIINEAALGGLFTFDATGGVQRQVNVMQLAAQTGNLSTFDPTIVALMNQIRSAAGTVGTINTTTNRNTQQYVFQAEGISNQYSPTTRVDFNLSARHRLSGTYYWQRFSSKPDLLNNSEPVFPGFPNQGFQESYRTTGSASLRSTLTANIVNEVRGGWQWSPNDFFGNITRDMFANQDFYSLGLPLGLTGATATRNAAPRNTTTWSVSDDFTYLRGSHTFTMGGSFSGLVNRGDTFDVAPALTIGFDTTNDPANGMFNTTNFPGASGGQLNDARALYALLTGRVASMANTARLSAETGKYVYLGPLQQRAKQNAIAAYIQDSWRWKPTVTLNAGLRYDLPLAFTPITATYSTIKQEDLCGVSGMGNGIGDRFCNLFTTNQTGKVVPQYYPFTPGTKAFNPNYTNFGYNGGIAWRPNVESGWLRTLLGDPAQATIRAGYSMTYNVERFDRFTANAGANPGGTTVASRNTGTGFCLVCPGESWPILFREKNRLGAPAFPDAPVYPISGTSANSLNMFNPDLKTPRVHSFSVGFQRSIGQDMAAEVRYVGNRNKFAWAEENWNERVVFENGFFDEWKLAAANLKANLAGGRGATFAFTGIPGTSPLPIHQAYLSGLGPLGAYSATQYTNTAFLARFSDLEPDVLGAAGALDTAAFRANANNPTNPLFPINFWVMNPNSSGTFVVMDREGSKYDSLQFELRRRLSQGLLVSANYTYGISYTSLNPSVAANNRSLRFDRLYVENTGIPHAYKVNWVYQLPVGRGKRFGSDMNSILNGVIGDWEFSGNARFQTQAFRMANAELVGMTESDLSKAFKIRITQNATTGATEVFSLPQDIIDNTRAAYSTDPTTATGYSAALGAPQGRYIKPAGIKGNCVTIYRQDCNTPDIQINGPFFKRVDISLKKRFPFATKASFEVNVEVMNVFNSVNFNHQLNPGDGANIFRVTTAYTDVNTTFDPGGRIGQIVWRINW